MPKKLLRKGKNKEVISNGLKKNQNATEEFKTPVKNLTDCLEQGESELLSPILKKVSSRK